MRTGIKPYTLTPMAATERPPTLDPSAAARWQRLPPPGGMAQSPWLHEEVARRMQERLDWIKRQPAVWAHWQPLRGGLQAHALLAKRYPQAQVLLVEPQAPHAALARQALAKPWWNPARWTNKAAAVSDTPPADGSVQLLWANMALHMAPDPQALIAQWHRALAVDGFVMFSCLGPDSLRELRGLYQRLGWPPAQHAFTDMHDWGDMLVQAGFAEPVMDMERIHLSFDTPQRLLQELRELGRNLHVGRFGALRGRGWREQLHAAMARELADEAEGGRLKLTFEVVYGHAFKPAPRLDVKAETVLSLDEMRRALQQGRR
jgi:malonyl-CoA O-methyltransferase